ncbi:MAG: hypothetical protein VXZ96_05005 [Myxococcota bacterium]|nr:hypothetical protein [Myxococcota bacterium]
MRLLTVIMISACATQNLDLRDTNTCAQDSSRLQLSEPSPIGIDAESYVDLVPNQFTTPLFLEGGQSSCLKGAIELDLLNITYINSTPNGTDSISDAECVNHILIPAQLELISSDGLLNEIIEIGIELDEIAVQNNVLNGRFEQPIRFLDGELGTQLSDEELVISGVLGESNIGMISLLSEYEYFAAEVSEERILAAWNNDITGCTE